jgi:hypothetical protein
MYNQGLRICNTQTTHLPINIMAYNFWDPSKDSLWGVYEKGQCVYVYCSKLQAQLAAEDIGGQLVEAHCYWHRSNHGYCLSQHMHGLRLHIRSTWTGAQTMAMQPTESVNTALGGVSPPSVITPSGDGYRTTGESCGTVQSNFF